MRVSERGVGERQRGRGKAGKRKEGEGRKHWVGSLSPLENEDTTSFFVQHTVLGTR